MFTVMLRFIYLLALAVWVGSMTFFSFLAAPSIFKALPRDEAGIAVTAMFPKYYWLGVVCGVVTLATSFAVGLRTRWNVLLLLRMILLGLMIAGVLYSVLVLQPKIHAVKVQIPAFERLSPTDPLRMEFGRLHGRSFGINAAVLLLGVVVVFITAFTMKV